MMTLREKEMEFSQQGVAVAKSSVVGARNGIAMAKDRVEESGRCSSNPWSQSALLQNSLLLGQQTLQSNKPGPS